MKTTLKVKGMTSQAKAEYDDNKVSIEKIKEVIRNEDHGVLD